MKKSKKIINKITNVDAKFKTSADDLCKALNRIGSSANDADVSLNHVSSSENAPQTINRREIKFRVWDKVSNQWIKKFYLTEDGICLSAQDMGRGYLPMPNEVTIQQFTGNKDVNGNDLYEGDIVVNNYGEIHGYSVYVAEMGRDMFFFKPENHKIIGNIFENPELLNYNK